jgi:small-conductance mechanosensitive channel
MEAIAAPSKGQLWTGRVLSTLAALFLLFDTTLKFIKPQVVIESTIALGYSVTVITPLAITLLICTILYIVPMTRVLGAILLTAYLGGAVATHVRHGDPLFSHILFPTYLGAFLWLGLYLRDPALRNFVPFRKMS